MTKKIASRIFYGSFILIFVIMVGMMVKGLIDQNKDEKLQNERYESMITEGGKTTLTDDILNEDYNKYVQDSEKAKQTFISLLVCFGAAIVLFIVMYIFSMIMKGMEDGAGTQLVIMIASFVVLIFMLGSFSVVALKFLVPRLTAVQPEKEAYYFNTLNIKDAVREEEKEEYWNEDHYETRTNVYYYYIDENDKKLSVSKVLFSRFEGEGVYYAGQTARGSIFSIYPAKYFELQQ